jgi:hypothetical protein
MQERILGDVVHFNSAKGFGFVSDANDQRHFFHIRFIRPLASGAGVIPRVGDLFYFSLRPSTSRAGHDEAFDLQLVRRAPPARRTFAKAGA